jgi:hypothetical protein
MIPLFAQALGDAGRHEQLAQLGADVGLRELWRHRARQIEFSPLGGATKGTGAAKSTLFGWAHRLARTCASAGALSWLRCADLWRRADGEAGASAKLPRPCRTPNA